MGDKRAILGLVVACIAVLLYFNLVLPALDKKAPWPPPERPGPARRAPELRPASRTSPPPARTTPLPKRTTPPAHMTAPARAPKAASPPPQKLQDRIEVTTESFQVILTNRGAAIKSIVLRDYYVQPPKDPQPGGGDLKLLTEIEPGVLSLTLAVGDGNAGLDRVNWEVVPCAVPEGFHAAKQFRTVLPDRRIEIVKTYLFRNPGEYGGRFEPGRDILLDVSVRNLGDRPVDRFGYRLRSAAGIVPEREVPQIGPLERRASRDIAAVVGGWNGRQVDIETFRPPKRMKRYTSPKQKLIYAGVKNRYFVAVLKPLHSEDEIRAVRIEKIGEHNVSANLEIAPFPLGPGATVTRRYMFFVAPRKPSVVAQYTGHRFEPLVQYGWPAPVTRLLAWLLQLFRKVTPNYGFAIVLLTICVRLLLHPLTLKSQKAAHKMQKIQPRMKEIKEKYKHDKKLQQQEMMKIWREEGASPLGGCLPMLLQLPIFIGLWRALYQDVSLRHAPFLLWINDLSQPDNLFSFGQPLPLFGWRSFNLLPLCCAVLMIVQHKMMPKSQDPQAQQQQKIMMFMPVMFAFLLYNMPSGLMVYFSCSTLFGLVEQRFIRRRLDALSSSAEAASPVPVEPKKAKNSRPQQKRSPHRRKKRRRK